MSKVRDVEINNEQLVGMYGHHLNEGPFIPLWKESGSEEVLRGNNNSFIVLGRDRDGHAGEGVGGQGGTGCGSIDIVAGLGGFDYKEGVKKQINGRKGIDKNNYPTDLRRTDPNFYMDAARVYITEKGNIDHYFGLAQGTERVKQSELKSAIGIKADHLRLVGREHIKIVTGKARLENGGTAGERNSGGGKIENVGKIDLIAGNYTDPEETGFMSIFGDSMGVGKTIRKLQPIPKGDNLKEILDRILDHVIELSSLARSNTGWIQNLTTIFQAHVHEFNVPFGPTSPPITSALVSLPVWVECWSNWVGSLVLTLNVIVDKIMFLFPFFSTYVNSRFVNTT